MDIPAIFTKGNSISVICLLPLNKGPIKMEATLKGKILQEHNLSYNTTPTPWSWNGRCLPARITYPLSVTIHLVNKIYLFPIMPMPKSGPSLKSNAWLSTVSHDKFTYQKFLLIAVNCKLEYYFHITSQLQKNTVTVRELTNAKSYYCSQILN